jgi:hypothetical protein
MLTARFMDMLSSRRLSDGLISRVIFEIALPALIGIRRADV